MHSLIIQHNNAPCTTSRMVAQKFNKRHSDVLRAINNVECSKEFSERNFALVKYTDCKNELRPEYIMTKNGFVFLVMGFTGKEAARFKEEYINAFDAMEQELLKQRAGALMLATADLVELIDKAKDIVGSYNQLAKRIKVSNASLSILRNYGIVGKPHYSQSERLVLQIEACCQRIVQGGLGYDRDLTKIILDITNKRARVSILDVLERKGAI